MDITELDLTGLSCPQPVLLAYRATRELIPGGILRIAVTDVEAPADLRDLCQTTGHEYLDCIEASGVFTISIRRPA